METQIDDLFAMLQRNDRAKTSMLEELQRCKFRNDELTNEFVSIETKKQLMHHQLQIVK